MAPEDLHPSLRRELTRRRFMALSALGLVSVPAVLEACAQGASQAPATTTSTGAPVTTPSPTATPAASQGLEGPIIVGSRGGSIGQAEKDVIWDPFSQKYGVEVIQFEAPDTDAIIQAQEEANKVELSYSITTDGGYKVLSEANYLTEIDYSKFSPTAQEVVNAMPKDQVRQYGLADSTVGVNVAYDTSKFSDPNSQPKTWADLWDVDRFPGGRGLYNGPIFTLEAALLADGVDPASLYPLDFDRAFNKLGEIKPHVVKWWDAGAQGPQLLIDQEATVVMAYNGRMETAILDGAPVGYSWERALTFHDISIVPANAPHLETALAALSFIYEPEVATEVAIRTGYPIPSTVLWEKAPEDVRARWPNAPDILPKLVEWNALWWAEPADDGSGKTRQEAITERFNAFISS